MRPLFGMKIRKIQQFKSLSDTQDQGPPVWSMPFSFPMMVDAFWALLQCLTQRYMFAPPCGSCASITDITRRLVFHITAVFFLVLGYASKAMIHTSYI